MAVPSQRLDPRRYVVQRVPAGQVRRFRRLKRLLKLGLVLAFLVIVAIVYGLVVYAPGLRTEARTIPARVEQSLKAQGASYVPGSQISPLMKDAIVSVEDRRFYSHPGVDPIGVVRALWINLTRRNIDQGGSTLEEQLAKRMIVHDDSTIRAKLRTMGLAWAIDQEFGKQHIIELYLNAAYFGRGAYGIGEAAHAYFGADPANLTIGQAAFLAALPQAPSIYGAQPTAPAITDRWHTVLQDMVASGYISASQEQAAAATKLNFALPG